MLAEVEAVLCDSVALFVDGPDVRSRVHPLAEERHPLEVFLQDSAELVSVEFLEMERIRVLREVTVRELVGRRNDKQSPCAHHATDLGQEPALALFRDVLYRLKGDDQVELLVGGEPKVVRGSDGKAEIRPMVPAAGVGDGLFAEVDPYDLPSHLRQEMGSIPFSTGNIKDSLARGELACKEISVPMLATRLHVLNLWDVPLTCVFHPSGLLRLVPNAPGGLAFPRLSGGIGRRKNPSGRLSVPLASRNTAARFASVPDDSSQGTRHLRLRRIEPLLGHDQ